MNGFMDAGLKVVAKKRLGQNFLVDQRAIDRIIEACGFLPDETVLEIGPGRGALTREILARVRRVVAVEADRSLADGLKLSFEGKPLEVHHADILKFDLGSLPCRPIKVMGNIPYNISTPIIARVIDERAAFSTLLMTVQHEFGLRIVARPGTRDFSSLSCFVQMFAEARMLFKIPPSAFRPMPRVMSCFMRLDMRPRPAEPLDDPAAFGLVVRQAFQQRRKNLLNSLSPLCPKGRVASILKAAGVDAQARAGDVSVAQYARIANAYHRETDLLSRH